MTIQDVKIEFQRKLATFYEPKEIQSIFSLIAEDLDFSPTYLILHKDDELSDTQKNFFEQCLQRLATAEPVQYIRGKADFYDLQFFVNPSVLIPRQETEELVNVILQENRNNTPKIIDLGTGSGCIAITLAKHLSNAKVSAVDVSEQALQTAKSNALKNDVSVDFYLGDMQDEAFMSQFPKFDIIVSNPPYVCHSEKNEMRQNVLHYEPHLALFVEDTNPLQFYRAIARFASEHLAENGTVYCEINETLGEETKQLFESFGFSKCEIRKDLFGKDRIVKVQK
ncbi:MAG: peptide chain release factor N(5)-glutamine methyltransferase [Bacteroidales bacterium]|nr:peptide chain release factor N(5)-glutamine methyltransferase [Bacteroidales bacterium]